MRLRKRKSLHRIHKTDNKDSDIDKVDFDTAQNTEQGLQSALQNSRKENNLLLLLTSFHTKRIGVLLTSNGLKRLSATSDGNCFYESLALQFEGKCATKLREEVCNHIEANRDHFINFMSNTPADGNDYNEDYMFARYKSVVDYLRQDGHWSVSLGDTLPSAGANLYKAQVQIYSSKPTQSVIALQPTFPGITADKTFTFAYIAIRGKEHYEACTKVLRKTQNDGKRNEATQKTATKRKLKERVNPISPRKQAKFQTPRKKNLTRKRQANPDSWKNIIKKLRQSGKAYTSVKGDYVPERSMRIKDCSKCKFKCSEKISEEQRQQIFNSYWKLQSHDRQRDYICDHVLEKFKAGVKKKVARSFTFHINGEIVRVCRSYFTSTLGIGRKTVECALTRQSMKTVYGFSSNG